MSLILGVNKGGKLYFNDNANLHNSVLEVLDATEDKTSITVNFNGKVFHLNDREFIQIYPTVFACVGKPKFAQVNDGNGGLSETVPRIAFDAPRTVDIQRKQRHLANVRNF